MGNGRTFDAITGEIITLAQREAIASHFDVLAVGHVMIAALSVSPKLREACHERRLSTRRLRDILRTKLGMGSAEDGTPVLEGARTTALLDRADAHARGDGRQTVSEGDLMQALLEEKDGPAADVATRLRAPVSEAPERAPGSRTPILDGMGRDLTARARDGQLAPFVGRQELLKRVMVVLGRHAKPNVVLVGEAGVGKTAVVEGLALRIAEGKVPAAFASTRIVAIEPSTLSAGASLAGELERRLHGLVAEAAREPDLVVFLDEIHTLMGIGSSAMTAADVLKPALARGELRVIGATTPAEYARFVERDSATARRFERIEVTEPSEAEAMELLEGMRARLEKHHAVVIEPAAIRAAVELSVRYLPKRRLPDKAIDCLDEACAKTRFRTINAGAPVALVITERAVAEVIADRAGVAIESLDTDERQALAELADRVSARVLGQEEAVATISRAVQRARVGLKAEARPVGSFLLTGPSGVGKTLLAQTFADLAFDGHLVRIDLSELQQAHDIARLVGAPPGYVGHNEEGVLTGALRATPHTVVLLDEADKAHPAVFDLLLQVLDAGRLTDGRGETVDASHALIFLTSNHLATPRRRVGFGGDGAHEASPEAQLAVQGAFRPEFIGRLDAVLRLAPISGDVARRVAQLQLADASRRLERLEVTLVVGEGVVEHVASTATPEYGARPIRGLIERDVIGRAGDLLLHHRPPVRLEVTATGGSLVLHVRSS